MPTGRNELCPCGSGKKYKKCCAQKKTVFDRLAVQELPRKPNLQPPVVSASTPPSKGKLFASILVSFLLPFLVYLNSLNAPFLFDDFQNIVDNQDIRHLENLKSKLIFQAQDYSKQNNPTRPVVYLTFSLNYYLGKLNTFGYHLTNLILHCLVAALLFLLSRRLLFSVYQEDDLILPLAIACIFACHPINTEVATYVSHRSESLAALFYLASLLCFIKAVEKSNIFYAFSLLSFTASLLSKEIAATLPLMVLVTDFIFLSDLQLQKVKDKKLYHFGYWIVLAIFLFWRTIYFGGMGDLAMATYQRWNNLSYFMTQPMVLLKYLKLLLFPVGQTIDHYILPAATAFEEGMRVMLLLVAGGIAALLYLTIRKYWKRWYPTSKILLFAATWFFVTLLPTSSFMPIHDAMAERRLYLPCWGFALFMTSFYLLTFKFRASAKGHKIMLLALGLHIFILGVLTFKRNRLYQNPSLLWEEVLARYPTNPRALNNLGSVYAAEGKEDRSLKQIFEKARDVDPDDYMACYNLALVYAKNQDIPNAILLYEKAIQLNPKYVSAYNNLGNIYKGQGQLEEALELFNRAVRIDPRHVNARYNLADAYLMKKDYKNAMQEFEYALKLAPNDAYIREIKSKIAFAQKFAK